MSFLEQLPRNFEELLQNSQRVVEGQPSLGINTWIL